MPNMTTVQYSPDEQCCLAYSTDRSKKLARVMQQLAHWRKCNKLVTKLNEKHVPDAIVGVLDCKRCVSGGVGGDKTPNPASA